MSLHTLDQVKEYLRAFAKERDWEQFHSPKNISMALAVEAAELLEHFQWLTEAQSKNLSTEQLEPIADEIADVQLYLIRLADLLGVDLFAAMQAKTQKNEAKYPADKVRGSAKKYWQYKQAPEAGSTATDAETPDKN